MAFLAFRLYSSSSSMHCFNNCLKLTFVHCKLAIILTDFFVMWIQLKHLNWLATTPSMCSYHCTPNQCFVRLCFLCVCILWWVYKTAAGIVKFVLIPPSLYDARSLISYIWCTILPNSSFICLLGILMNGPIPVSFPSFPRCLAAAVSACQRQFTISQL